MKNLLIAIFALVLTFSITSTSEAKKRKSKEDKVVDDFQKTFKRKYGTAGCGLGSIALGSKPGMIQIFAATLNGIGYNQTFAMTSGTANCVGPMGTNAAKKMDIFLEFNNAQFAADLSRGQGETLGTIAYIMGCSNSQKLGSALKTNYSTVYSSEAAQFNEITDNVVTVILNDKELSQDCKNLADLG